MTLTGNFDKLNHGKADNADPENTEDIENYNSAGNARNLCFVQLDGKQTFLNYAYLISGEYSPEENSIVLTYTTNVIKLKGYNLDILFEILMAHLPKKIKCIDKRYKMTRDDVEAMVFEIKIKDSSNL